MRGLQGLEYLDRVGSPLHGSRMAAGHAGLAGSHSCAMVQFHPVCAAHAAKACLASAGGCQAGRRLVPFSPASLQVADAKHPSVHKELRELATFRGPVDHVYRSAPPKVVLDNGSGGSEGRAGWAAGGVGRRGPRVTCGRGGAEWRQLGHARVRGMHCVLLGVRSGAQPQLRPGGGNRRPFGF